MHAVPVREAPIRDRARPRPHTHLQVVATLLTIPVLLSTIDRPQVYFSGAV